MAVSFTRLVAKSDAGTNEEPFIVVPAGGIPLNAVLVLFYSTNNSISHLNDVTDSQGNNWIINASNSFVEIWATRVTIPLNAGDTIQVVCDDDGSPAKAMGVLEFADPTGLVGTTATAASTSSSAVSGTAVSNTRTAGAGERLLAAALHIRESGGSFTESGDYTQGFSESRSGGINSLSTTLFGYYKLIDGGTHTFNGNTGNAFVPHWTTQRSVFVADELAEQDPDERQDTNLEETDPRLIYPAPEFLPHDINVNDVGGNTALQRKLQENFEALNRFMQSFDPYRRPTGGDF